MYELMVQGDFSAAHRLRRYQGECERLHGHNYRVEFLLAGDKLNPVGVLVDFKEVKRIAREVLGRLDHQYLNELEPFDTLNPTTEQLARYIAEEVASRLPEGVAVKAVTCWETDRCAARYVPDVAAGAERAED